MITRSVERDVNFLYMGSFLTFGKRGLEPIHSAEVADAMQARLQASLRKMR
jgi:hypothetical protein